MLKTVLSGVNAVCWWLYKFIVCWSTFLGNRLSKALFWLTIVGWNILNIVVL